jgi:hypothetical protein
MGSGGGPARSRRPRTALVLGAALVALLAGGGTTVWLRRPTPPTSSPPPPIGPELAAEIRQFCTACHAFPPADTFPRSSWAHEVKRGYDFFERSNLALDPPPRDRVVQYFEERAPRELPRAVLEPAPGPPPVSFESLQYAGHLQARPPAVANVNLVHLFDKDRLDVLTCDMRHGRVLALSPYLEQPLWRLLGTVSHPAHAEVVDLDRDGIPDILVANLGSFLPTDDPVGSVVWLRGSGDGRFTPCTLFEGVGRVADVQAADFDGDGKLDLVVAAFGRNQIGEIYYLHNQTEDWSQPRFEPRVLDARHGAIHVPICDLNKDGKPDFVALISQEHETVVAFLNEGGGRFRKETLWTAPHPAYGSSGIQVVDLDGDGDLDVLYTNGDVLDGPYLLKPYHGVQWLENRGGFPFVHHPLGPLYGAHRAVAADLDGDGLLDVLAVSFLPREAFPQRESEDLDAVVLFRQASPGRFVRHALAKGSCDHATCAAGDVFGTGRVDFVTGGFLPTRDGPAVTVWKNRLSPKPR